MLTRVLLVVVLGGIYLFPSHHAHAQDEVTWLYEQINALRATLGLSGYRLNGSLSAAAQSHSEWMAATGIIAHEEDNGSGPPDRAATYGYGGLWVAENIYGGVNANASTAWNWWLNSPTHYNAITSASKTDVGIGIAQGSGMRFYTLLFGQGSTEGLPPPQPTADPNLVVAAVVDSIVAGADEVITIREESSVPQAEVAVDDPPLPPPITFTPSPTIPTYTPTITWTPTFTWTPSLTTTPLLPTTTPVQLGTAIPLEVALAMTPSITPSPSQTSVLVALSSVVDSYTAPRSPQLQATVVADEESGFQLHLLLIPIIGLQVVGLGWVLWRLVAKKS